MKRLVIFGAGETGSSAYYHYGPERVAAFADSYKTGTFCGKPIWSLRELVRRKGEVDVVVASLVYAGEIIQGLEQMGIAYRIYKERDLADLFDPGRLAPFHGRHNGGPCFLIGTGPSLRLEDLETLRRHGIPCIGANKIFLSFEQTRWRPDYYLVIDRRIIRQYAREIAGLKLEHKFVALHSGPFWNGGQGDSCLPVRIRDELYTRAMPSFSCDIRDCIYEGNTVTYAAMQLAASLGFTELYLLGVDFDYSGDMLRGDNHFMPGYFKPGEAYLESSPHRVLLAYQKAEAYSRRHGFRIFNATRGGKLEVFERVDFERLFPSPKEEAPCQK